MFYEPQRADHGLRHDPFKALVAPRPIGWISSRSAAGTVNLAPYSFFNAVSSEPPVVMFSSEGLKDTIRNVIETGEFVCNIVGRAQTLAMNATSAPLPPGENEFRHAGLEEVPSRLVAPPRVRDAAAALECRLLTHFELKDLEGRATGRHVAFGQVVGVHIEDRVIVAGRVDVTAIQPLARLGYKDYSAVEAVFELERPGR